MEFAFTAQASQKIRQILAEKGSHLALRIQIRSGLMGPSWSMSLEPHGPETLIVDGVPVTADAVSLRELQGLVIDWTQTPDGPGFGVYDRNLQDRPAAKPHSTAKAKGVTE